MWSLTWKKQKIFAVQKLAVPTDVAVTAAVATIAKTVAIKPRLCILNSSLRHLLRGYQRNSL